MSKKAMMSLVAILSMLMSPFTAFAETIGQDYSVEKPLYSSFESAAEAEAVNAQLTTLSAAAKRSEDSKDGNYALEVNQTSSTSSEYEFSLIDSGPFDATQYSKITLWVKPKEKAKWISFYTNGTLILGDADNDGTFTVGTDLVGGKWNRITLDLSSVELPNLQGEDLTVKVNSLSCWMFDGISTQKSRVSSVDLSSMTNAYTEYTGGELKYGPQSGLYKGTDTVLTSSGAGDANFNFSTSTDFSSGTRNHATVGSNGITFSLYDMTTGGTPLESSHSSTYIAANAFDDNTNTYWQSGESGASVKNHSYIGYQFSQPKTIAAVKSSIYETFTARLEYYSEQESRWIGVKEIYVSGNQQFINLDISAQKWRFLAINDYTGNWQVRELELTGYGDYTSSTIDLGLEDKDYASQMSWSGTVGTDFLFETRLSYNNGATWENWTVVEKDEEISGIRGAQDLSDTVMQYRVSVSKSTSSTPVLNSVSINIQSNDTADITLPAGSRIQGVQVDSGANSLKNDLSSYYISGSWTLSRDGKNIYTLSGQNILTRNLITGVQTTFSVNANQIYDANYDASKIRYRSNPDNYYFELDTSTGSSTSAHTMYRNYFADDQHLFMLSATQLEFKIAGNTNANILSSGESITNSVLIGSLNRIYYFGKTASPNSVDYIRYMGCKNGIWESGIVTIPSGMTISNPVGGADGNLYFNVSSTDIYRLNTTSMNVERQSLTGTLLGNLAGNILISQVRPGGTAYLLYDTTTGQADELDVGENIRILNGIAQDIILYNYSILKKLSFSNDYSEKYLLSFDGKASWLTYQNGEWKKASERFKPTVDEIKEYGITKAQINALTERDFDRLREDGQEIYTMDFAVYFTSDENCTSPLVKSIKVSYTQESSAGFNKTENPIFAAKTSEFDGTGWRKIFKIYPLEKGQSEFDYRYFISADDSYWVYKNGAWAEDTEDAVPGMIAEGIGGNWISIKEAGMSSDDLRAIPENALSSKLAGKTFSLLCVMKVYDESTQTYSVNYNIDYAKTLYAGTSLTLKITFVDGSEKSYAGLTNAQVEDFMEWLNRRQKGIGPIFYTIEAAGSYDYLNYYMIQAVNVLES